MWMYANPDSYKGMHYPYLYYVGADNGRFYDSAKWYISLHEVLLDPNAHWRDKPGKAWNVYRREEKDPQFVLACEWMKKRFKIKQLIKTPFGSWMDAEFVEKRNKEIEELYKALPKENIQ
jgi:hypothetical protein